MPSQRIFRTFSCISFILLVVQVPFSVHGQLPSYSNPFEFPILLNPANTGFCENMRLSMVGQSQWMSTSSPYNHVGASFDVHFGHYHNHNVGISITNDIQGPMVMQLGALNLYYAYMVDLTYQWRMRIGASVGAMMKATNYNKLVFADMLGEGARSPIAYQNKTSFSPDFALGIAFEFEGLDFGVAAHHLAEPSFDQANRDFLRVHRRFSLHASYRYNIYHLYRFKKPFYLVPFILASQQQRHIQLTGGLGVEYQGIRAAIFVKEDVLYPSHNLYASVGWVGEYFGGVYTYGISFLPNGVRGLNASTHELNLHLMFPYPRQWNIYSTYGAGRKKYTRYSSRRAGARYSRRRRR